MDKDDSWPKVWAEMSEEELRDRLRHYLFLAANSPLQHATRSAQLVAEADKRGKGLAEIGGRRDRADPDAALIG